MSHTERSLPRLLTPADVASQFGYSLPRIYELCRRGLIPHIRFGRQIRFDPSRLREWMEAGGTPLSESEAA